MGKVNILIMEDIRSFNVGNSDYAKHKFQSWDFWLTYVLNPFDADLCKRILRTKEQDGRLMDYQKIKHICGERLRQLSLGPDVYNLPKSGIELSHFEEMIKDYNLCDEDKSLLQTLLYNHDRTYAYKRMQEICEDRMKQLQSPKPADLWRENREKYLDEIREKISKVTQLIRDLRTWKYGSKSTEKYITKNNCHILDISGNTDWDSDRITLQLKTYMPKGWRITYWYQHYKLEDNKRVFPQVPEKKMYKSVNRFLHDLKIYRNKLQEEYSQIKKVDSE